MKRILQRMLSEVVPDTTINILPLSTQIRRPHRVKRYTYTHTQTRPINAEIRYLYVFIRCTRIMKCLRLKDLPVSYFFFLFLPQQPSPRQALRAVVHTGQTAVNILDESVAHSFVTTADCYRIIVMIARIGRIIATATTTTTNICIIA